MNENININSLLKSKKENINLNKPPIKIIKTNRAECDHMEDDNDFNLFDYLEEDFFSTEKAIKLKKKENLINEKERDKIFLNFMPAVKCLKRVSDVDGLQVRGIVGEVDKDNLEKVVKNYYQFVFKDPKEREEWEAPYTYFLENNKPIYRFFQIMPTEIYKRDTEYLDGDRRVKIDIDTLKKYN